MNTRYLAIVLSILVVVGIAITTRSTLEPGRGADHVFYGAEASHFIGQEIAIGDFNGDGIGDIVTTGLWDDPAPGGAPRKLWYEGKPQSNPCAFSWGVYSADSLYNNGNDTLTVSICWFKNPAEDALHWGKWEELGWILSGDTSATCDTCWTIEHRREDQGIAYIVAGGDWSGVAHDIDWSIGGADRVVAGEIPGGRINNGIAAGDVVVDAACLGCDELILGAPGVGAGEVYVILGAQFGSTPDTVRTPSGDEVAHRFLGRRPGSEFGLGIASGDLNGDGKDDVVVVAPSDDAMDSTRVNAGVVYIFYSTNELPAEVDLSVFVDDTTLVDSTSAYLQVIHGAATGDGTGVTELQEKHEDGHTGSYEPVGLAIGDWDGNGFDDLAIGGGHVNGGEGAVYVIFGAGGPGPFKLVPGNTIDLAIAPGGQLDRPDVRFAGWEQSRFGAGVAFVDADAEGDADPLLGTRDDLIIGAPYARLGGSAGQWEYFGETYIVWGDARGTLTDNRDYNDTTNVGVTIIGRDFDDQLGGHMSGHFDIDNDDKNDIGIAGQDAIFVLFGQDRNEWPDTLDLATVLQDSPKTRVLQWTGVPAPSSTTIRLADLDDDDNHDLVFGGYDMRRQGVQRGAALRERDDDHGRGHRSDRSRWRRHVCRYRGLRAQ